MQQRDIEILDGIKEERTRASAYFNQHSPVFRSLMDLEEVAFANGALTKGQKELLAFCVSVVIDSESGMQCYADFALDHGITKEQIIEAIGIAIVLGGGPASVSARFALKVLENHKDA